MTSKPPTADLPPKPSAASVVPAAGTLPIRVAAFYRFVPFPDYADYRRPLLDVMLAAEVRGTVLLAEEGINGTIAGSRSGVERVLSFLQQAPRFKQLEIKQSEAAVNPFLRSKVKLKREIVTMGVAAVDGGQEAGTYVRPKDWNALLEDPEVLLLDVRNRYETAIGSFSGAVIPGTESFRQFPDYAARHLNPAKQRKVAMFCTGGIRCEKASAYLKQQGFEQVYHLQGGILKYLEQVPAAESKWRGECFVFDERVSVDHGLQQGKYEQCHACRMPISAEDRASEFYQQGISCPHCHGRKTPAQTSRYQERRRQMALAKARGEAHLGQTVPPLITTRRQAKLKHKAQQRQQS